MEKNLGHAYQSTQTPFSKKKTVARIASIAKPMTAIAVSQRYEQGLVDLEAAIQKICARFSSKRGGRNHSTPFFKP
jgi:CubicO group peptidase (beta-lactamase class C family)